MKLKSGLVAFMLNGQEMGRACSTASSAHTEQLILLIHNSLHNGITFTVMQRALREIC